jgi:hypothetical protein
MLILVINVKDAYQVKSSWETYCVNQRNCFMGHMFWSI